MSRLHAALAAGLGLCATAQPAHAGRPYRFGNAAPITDMRDLQPVPVPRARAIEQAGDWVFDSAVRYPPVGFSETWKIPRAGDVNALDDVPASSWFTPGLGSREISPDELLARQSVEGAPRLPLAVLQVYPGALGGILTSDVRGKAWFVDFDRRGHPALQTSAGVLANRIFRAFGQNVPEDHVIALRPDELVVPDTDTVTRSALDALLTFAEAPVEGRLRARASRRLEGIVLGPFSPRGVRIDDPNDLVPHEDRRTLRALRVLAAFVNLQEIRPANTLDVYEGAADQGYVRHYFLDMGQAFGGAADSRRYWSGYNHYFSLHDALKNLVTAGLFVGPWELETRTPWPSVGSFEAARFEPSGWRETAAFRPIRRSQPEDDYWAAARLAAFLPAHIEALVRSVGFPEPGAAEYMVSTLLERRRKLVDWAFSRVTPLDTLGVLGSDLRLRDRGRELPLADAVLARYRVTTFDGGGRTLETHTVEAGSSNEVRVPLRPVSGAKDEYLRVEVLVVRNGREAPRPAEFHLRPGADGAWRLVGVVH